MQCAKPFTPCQENPLLMAFLLYHQLRIYELLNIHHDGDTKEGHTICTQKKKPIILCGDLNVAAEDIDLKNPQANISFFTLSPNVSFFIKFTPYL